MPLPADNRTERLLGLKTLQMRLRSAAATEAKLQAQQQRVEAEVLRESAQQTVQAGIPLPEQGLGRAALFERLRLLAVARAHAMELSLQAGDLEQQAAQLDALEADHRHAVHAHQRKRAKLEHWQGLQRRHQHYQRDHRQTLELLEDTACRRRSIR